MINFFSTDTNLNLDFFFFLANILNSQILLHFRVSNQNKWTKKLMNITQLATSPIFQWYFLPNNYNLPPVILCMYLFLLSKQWSYIKG